jgi:hypothetical protein
MRAKVGRGIQEVGRMKGERGQNGVRSEKAKKGVKKKG